MPKIVYMTTFKIILQILYIWQNILYYTQLFQLQNGNLFEIQMSIATISKEVRTRWTASQNEQGELDKRNTNSNTNKTK